MCRVFTSSHDTGHYSPNSVFPVTGDSQAEQLSIGNSFAAIKSFAGNAFVSLKNVERRI